MANKSTREQVLGVVARFVGKDSAIYETCVLKFAAGSHPNEVLMWLQQRLRATRKDPAERIEFYKWASEQELSQEKSDGGSYVSEETEAAWQGWMARSELPQSALWCEVPPQESGWYWHWDGECFRVHFAFMRPGHAYMCTELPTASGKKHSFADVCRMGGMWLRIPIPASPTVVKPGDAA